MRSYLDRGYTVVKMKIGGAPIDEDRRRIEAVLAEIGGEAQLAVDANGRFDLETAIAYAKMLRDYPICSGTKKRAIRWTIGLQAALAEFYPGPMATGENLFSHQDARNLLRYGGMRPDRDWLQFDCALSYGLCEYLRTLEVLRGRRMVAAALHPAWRAPDVAEHRRRPGARRQRELSRPVPAFRRISGWRARGGRATSPCRNCRGSASRAKAR